MNPQKQSERSNVAVIGWYVTTLRTRDRNQCLSPGPLPWKRRRLKPRKQKRWNDEASNVAVYDPTTNKRLTLTSELISRMVGIPHGSRLKLQSNAYDCYASFQTVRLRKLMVNVFAKSIKNVLIMLHKSLNMNRFFSEARLQNIRVHFQRFNTTKSLDRVFML